MIVIVIFLILFSWGGRIGEGCLINFMCFNIMLKIFFSLGWMLLGIVILIFVELFLFGIMIELFVMVM